MISIEMRALPGHRTLDSWSSDCNNPRSNQSWTESIPTEVVGGGLSLQASTYASRLVGTHRESRFFGGWRSGVSLGLVAAILVFIVNLSVAVWTSTRHITAAGTTTVFEGDCAKARHISLWAHPFINILSTLLLGASNNALQCITSPTREEVEAAHAEDKWMDIGVPSIGNVFRIAGYRRLLWVCLALSSIPLHLLYV